MANEAIITQGSFTQPATAVTQYLNLRYDPDWVQIVNMTEAAAANANAGVSYYWSGLMGQNEALVNLRNAAATAVDMSTSTALGVGGVSFIDTTLQQNGTPVVLTVISGATPPRATVASTAGLSTGDTVQIYNPIGAAQLGGYYFTIAVIDATHFDLIYGPTIANAGAAATTFRRIPNLGSFQPRRRLIAAISQAAQAVVRFTVTHDYSIGDKLRLYVSSQYGMTQINGLAATVLAVNAATNSVTIDINTTGFTAFAFPLTAVAAVQDYQYPQAVPFGEDTSVALAAGVDPLSDSLIDTSFIGLVLPVGITSPGGRANDTVIWRAGSGAIPNPLF